MSEQPASYGIDDTIRIPITLENEVGIAHVRAVFWRIKQGGSIGPRGLAPERYPGVAGQWCSRKST